MEKVLSITGRIENRKRQVQVKSNRDKFDAVQRLLQCGSCRFKCAMCGTHAEKPESSNPQEKCHAEFSLCESCGAEYDDYMKIIEKKGQPNDIFWHNREWLEMWSCWVAHQRALKKFRQTFNMKQLPDNGCK
ncbi:MAG: hypothetical protein B6240_12930 [Desulfobacteraceae bacterium 4572_87]|nr:MAG: hypothetical protein B6240_12930 [Desulfobacteraceae bacterium 4572_87]